VVLSLFKSAKNEEYSKYLSYSFISLKYPAGATLSYAHVEYTISLVIELTI